MNKIVAAISITLMFCVTPLLAKDESAKSQLFDRFKQLSKQSISEQSISEQNTSGKNLLPKSNGSHQQTNPFDSPSVFIERELAQSLSNIKEPVESIVDPKGQWSVSFDLNRLGLNQTQWGFGANNDELMKQKLNFDWELGTSLVSPDKTSRFYVNYGNRKLPISISFDDVASMPALTQDALSLGFEQSFNESWAVSISYLKTENEFSSIIESNASAQSMHQLNYLFDFNPTNRLETVNFSPFSHDLNQTNFMDDISAIQIKVSRKISDDLMFSAKASQEQSNVTNEFATKSLFEGAVKDYQSQQLALEGNYRLTDRWSLDADIEHQMEQFETPMTQESHDFNQLDSTTLDIGVQYQSNWDQVGVVIRIDLMNLLGVTHGSNESLGLDNNGLKPFSFETPKYIKVTGSINF